MNKPIFLSSFLFYMMLGCFAVTGLAATEKVTLKPFVKGSLDQIVAAKQGKPFMLVIWSKDCPVCLKEMQGLTRLRDEKPGLDIVFLAADDPADEAEVTSILERFGLSDAETWIFGDSHAQRLRYEIDPGWYGELPRTYFYDAAHQRTAESGLVEPSKVESWMEAATP